VDGARIFRDLRNQKILPSSFRNPGVDGRCAVLESSCGIEKSSLARNLHRRRGCELLRKYVAIRNGKLTRQKQSVRVRFAIDSGNSPFLLFVCWRAAILKYLPEDQGITDEL
jgi:hypothetical protein